MRRAALLALMTALLLCGCRSDARQREMIEERRAGFESGAEFTAEVTADLGDEAFSFTARCTVSPEEAVMTLVSPEPVAGVTARLGADGAQLEFDGLILDLGALAEGELGPVGALGALAQSLRAGPVTAVFEENGLTVVQSYADESSYVLTRYDSGTLTPVHAQLVTNGRGGLECDISDFSALTADEKEG